MTSAIDLGHMRLGSTNTTLSLALSNSARLSFLGDTGRDTLTHSLFDPLASSPAWISRGTHLRLLLDITFQDDIANLNSTLELRTRLTTALLKTPVSCWFNKHTCRYSSAPSCGINCNSNRL